MRGTPARSSTSWSTSRDLPGAGQGEPVHLLGNSLGGLVSLLVAARRPDLVASLTLVSPAMPVYRVPPAFSRALLLLLLRASRRWPSAGWPASRPSSTSAR